MTRYGYARVSTTKQSTDSQTSDLQKEGIPPDRVITETLSGATSWKQRPELSRLVHRLKAGDTLTVAKLDRLGRNAVDVLSLIDILKKRQIAVRILNLGIDTSGAGGRLFLLLLAGFAEFERNIIRERIMAGLDVARAKGKRPGRRSTLSPEKTAQARAMKQRGLSSREVSELLQVSRMTAWGAMNSLKGIP
ncbi:recombinase family protein [Acetobacter senegalensis]|uniref:recombinase family protein n=1 Tax=Acetobacter senegalensis TaxID=446692 RepID=UPI001EDB2165|nr:recombinase family protein [Acetobacter senegalensis]MCG4261974.1 recombinase family protein [Acetobacter senegalensis]